MTRTQALSRLRRARKPARVATLVVFATGVAAAGPLVVACSDDSSELGLGRRRASRGASSTGTPGGGSRYEGAGDTPSAAGRVGAPDNVSGAGSGEGASSAPGDGTSNPGGSPGSTTGKVDFDLNLAQPTAEVNLVDETTFQVTVAPKGMTGNVALSVTGLPAGATATFSPPSVAVSGSAGATSSLTINSGTLPPGDAAIKIVGTSGAVTKEAAATVKVAARLVIKIPQNANTNATNFGRIELTKGAGPVEIVWQNPTSDVVQIHRQNNAAGLSHGANIPPGGSETRTVRQTGNFAFYVHDGADQGNPGRLIVK